MKKSTRGYIGLGALIAIGAIALVTVGVSYLAARNTAAGVAADIAAQAAADQYKQLSVGATNQIPSTVALFETSLASRITANDTSFTLVSATTKDGSTLASSTYGFIIDEGTSNEEMVLADCTATACTNATRGLSALTGTTTVTALKKAHSRGASVKITDGPVLLILNRLVQGIDTFPNLLSYNSSISCDSSTAGTAICPATFIRALAGQGAATSTTSLGGIVQLATALQTASSTDLGADIPLVLTTTNATDTPQRGCATGYSSTAGAGCTVIASLTGKIKQAWLNLTDDFTWAGNHIFNGSATFNGTVTFNTTPAGLFSPYFGDGRDGSLTVAGGATTTLTHDSFFTNLTVNGALVTNGCRVFVSGTLSGTGSINYGIVNAGSNGADASGSAAAGGAGGATTTSNCQFTNVAGTKGGAGSGAAGVAAFSLSGAFSKGQAGGVGGSGAAAGTVATKAATTTALALFSENIFSGLDGATTTDYTVAASRYFYMPSTPATGGGGGANVSQGGGGGGGGGASGGLIWIFANTWAGTFKIISQGGNGGNGGAQGSGSDTGGGAGAGGNGGSAIVVYSSKTWTGSYALTGGTHGTAGAGGSPGSGTSGLTGASYEIPITSIIR